MHRGGSFAFSTSSIVSLGVGRVRTIGAWLSGRLSGTPSRPGEEAARPNSLTSSSLWPSQCATSCHTVCFTSARKFPVEHRKIGPRKMKIKSGAILVWKCCRSVRYTPLYNPSISLPLGQFLRWNQLSTKPVEAVQSWPQKWPQLPEATVSGNAVSD